MKPFSKASRRPTSGLIDKGLVSYQVKDGKVSLSVVPYKVASFKDLVSSGQQAQANYERFQAISPGLKQIEGVGITAAGAYAAAVVAVAAAPLGPFLAGGLSNVAGQTTETVLKNGSLPTKESAAFNFLLGGAVGKIADNVFRQNELVEIGLSKSTQARQEASSAVAPVINTIFDNKVPANKLPPNVAASKNVTNTQATTTQQPTVSTPTTTAATTTTTAEAVTVQANQKQAVSQKFQDLATQGHGPQRHGPAITEQQLDDRAIKGFDPVTGSTLDGYKKLPNGNPAPHKSGRTASKVLSEENYVKAEDFIRNSPEFKNNIAAAEAQSKKFADPVEVKLEDIYGANYKDAVFGKTRVGPKNTGSSIETDFTDGTMKACYVKENGNWNLHTMYPEPK